MSRQVLAEHMHIINCIPPIDINGAGADGDIFSLKDGNHASIIVQLGVTGATLTITVEECDNVTPSNSTAIAFKVYKEETANGDTLGDRTAVLAAGLTTSANDGIFYVIEIDAEDLTEGFPYVRVRLSDPSAATLASAVAVISGFSGAGAGQLTQIT